ncbi:hypothetical protein [Psittacicella gerlachiana]|uniref:Uncharacterized protein n=1 Tax=Psittacicella gerlachiana TaxID=2028574 RepID=A0A3A1YIX5_9GAMM|nr:hypothetical protein [Psittacicella gerlachiana]RIY36194.1 hypothetical protein CKF59_02895 [Psittacicella gerlachiana]
MSKLKSLLIAVFVALSFSAPQVAWANNLPTVAQIAQANGEAVNSAMLNVNGNILVAKLYQKDGKRTIVITSRKSQAITQQVDLGNNTTVYASADVSRANIETLVQKLNG